MWESARHVRGSTAHFDEFDDNFEVGAADDLWSIADDG